MIGIGIGRNSPQRLIYIPGPARTVNVMVLPLLRACVRVMAQGHPKYRHVRVVRGVSRGESSISKSYAAPLTQRVIDRDLAIRRKLRSRAGGGASGLSSAAAARPWAEARKSRERVERAVDDAKVLARLVRRNPRLVRRPVRGNARGGPGVPEVVAAIKFEEPREVLRGGFCVQRGG